MPPVIESWYTVVSSPLFWLHGLFAVILLAVGAMTGWLLHRTLRRNLGLLAAAAFIFPLLHLLVVHPAVMSVAAMVFTAFLLRLAGRYGRRPHPGPLFFLLNLTLGSGAVALLLLQPSFLPAWSLPLLHLSWPLFNLLAASGVFFRLDGQRAQHAKWASAVLLLPWFATVLYNLFLAIGLATGSFLSDQPDFASFPSRILQLLHWPALLLTWIHFAAGGVKRKEHGNSEASWGKETLKQLLNHFSVQLAEGTTPDAFLQQSAVKLMSTLGSAGAAIFLLDEYEDVLRPAAVAGDFPPVVPIHDPGAPNRGVRDALFLNLTLPLENPLLEPACSAGKVSYFETVALSDEFLGSPEATDWEDLCLMTAPLAGSGRLLGVTAVTFPRTGKQLHPRLMRRFKDVSKWLGDFFLGLLQSIGNLDKQKIEIESQQIREIQELLLPRRLPKLASISLGAASRAARGVSGDFYDVIPLRKGEILIVIGDVAGKGIPAGMAMVMIRTILHLFAHQKSMTPARLLEIVNWGIAGKVSLDRFATLTLVHYSFADKRAVYSNAAHHPLLLYRTSKGGFGQLDSEGIPIGLEKKSKYQEIRTRLEKNDIIVLYTDGIIEAVGENGGLYGLDRLKRLVAGQAGQKADKIVEALKKDLDVFCGKAHRQDDQTLLIMKVEE